MRTKPADRLEAWYSALEARQMSALTFQEVRRGLQALSSLYVERRARLASGAALEGAGKRAAFALFYGPMHFCVVGAIVRAVGAAEPPPRAILDLGCGTGAAGAAFALEAGGTPILTGVDRNAWAVEETGTTWKHFGLRGAARRRDLDRMALPARGHAIVAAFTVNEIDEATRDRLLPRLIGAAERGARVLVVEPMARRAFPWWQGWASAFQTAGGREDSWRLPADLPERWHLLDRAAGLEHAELMARSLWLGGAGS